MAGNRPCPITQLQAAGHRWGRSRSLSRLPGAFRPREMPVAFERTGPDSQVDANAKWRNKKERAYTDIAGPDGDFAIETLEELGYPEATTSHRGGDDRPGDARQDHGRSEIHGYLQEAKN